MVNIVKMAKDKIMYVCENCGQESAKWLGKCPSCNQWNTFKEIRVAAQTTGSNAARSAAHSVRNGSITAITNDNKRPFNLRSAFDTYRSNAVTATSQKQSHSIPCVYLPILLSNI